jgi:hypothetical protein
MGQSWPSLVGYAVWNQTELPSVSCFIWPTLGESPWSSYFQLSKGPTQGVLALSAQGTNYIQVGLSHGCCPETGVEFTRPVLLPSFPVLALETMALPGLQYSQAV